MRTWMEEQVYISKRAAEIRGQLRNAILRKNEKLFLDVYSISFRYLPKFERITYYKEFLNTMKKEETV